MTAAINSEGKGTLSIAITGANNTDNAGLGSIANPEGVDLIITRTTFHMKTASDGAANLAAGITTAAAKATDILNDLDVNSDADGTVYNGHAMQNTAKTAITAPAKWTSDKYLTLTGSADTTGLTGALYVEYVRV